MHVKFMVDPSWYGPTILSVTAAPRSSRIVMWVGGTVAKKRTEEQIIHRTTSILMDGLT